MKYFLISLFGFCLILVTSALGMAIAGEQFTQSSFKAKINKIDVSLAYPVLLKDAVPAWNEINDKLVETLKGNICEPDPEWPDDQQYYEVNAKIVAMTQAYVSIKATIGYFCGGAHPAYETKYITYDALTADFVDVAREVPIQKYDVAEYDFSKLDAYQLELADIISKTIKPENDVFETCPDEMANSESIAETFYPLILGLGKKGEAIIGTSPPHVMQVCQFELAVPFEKVKQYLDPQSIVIQWMKRDR